MKFPSFIKQGDTIGFAAPSFGCGIEPYYSAFNHNLENWKKAGFQTQLGPNCYEDKGIGISNTPEKCANELMSMYQDNEVNAILSCGGGELMCEILSYMDFSQIEKAEPKWYMGYSDNTNFTFLLTTLADTAAIYGPNAGAFGMEPWHSSIQDAFELLQGKKLTMKNYPMWEKESLKNEEHPLMPYNVTEPFQMQRYLPSGENVFCGRLVGGCMDCLSTLVGTRFDKVTAFVEKYKQEGIVWFLEACELNVMDIRRTLWKMKEAGWFQNASGFLIGRPMIFDEPMMGLNQYEAVIGILKDLQVPIIMDLDIGHVAPMMPLVCGSYATITTEEKKFQIQMEMRA